VFKLQSINQLGVFIDNCSFFFEHGIHIFNNSMILNFIRDKNIKNMKRWSDRKNLDNNTKSVGRKNLIINVRKLLENISGTDIVEMLNSKLF